MPDGQLRVDIEDRLLATVKRNVETPVYQWHLKAGSFKINSSSKKQPMLLNIIRKTGGTSKVRLLLVSDELIKFEGQFCEYLGEKASKFPEYHSHASALLEKLTNYEPMTIIKSEPRRYGHILPIGPTIRQHLICRRQNRR
jgi:hypothetical protein